MNRYYIYALLLVAFCSCASQPETTEVALERSEIADQSIKSVTFTKEQIELAEIVIGNIKKRVIADVITANGKIVADPNQTATISVPYGGIIKNIAVSNNQFVSKGDVLLNVWSSDFVKIQENFLTALSQVELSRKDYERQQSLSADEATSVKALEQSKAAYNMAKANLEATRQLLVMLDIDTTKVKNGVFSPGVEIKSPITGKVSLGNINIGMIITPTDNLMSVVSTKDAKLSLNIYEKDLANIKVGNNVIFKLINDSEYKYSGTVSSIGSEVDSEKRVISVMVNINNITSDIILGMFVNANIEQVDGDHYSIENNGIVDAGGDKYIFESKDGKFYPHKIVLGVENDIYSEIMNFSELPLESQFVTKGAYYIQSQL